MLCSNVKQNGCFTIANEHCFLNFTIYFLSFGLFSTIAIFIDSSLEFGKHDKVTNEFKMNFGGAPLSPVDATDRPVEAVHPKDSAPATSSILSIASVVALYLLAH